MRRLAVVMAVFLIAAMLAGALLFRSAAGKELEPAQAQVAGDWKTFEARVMADQARWQDSPLLAPRTGEDAASFIAAHVRYEYPKSPSAVKPEHAAYFAKYAEGEWASHLDELDLAGADVEWMSHLQPFGFWSFDDPAHSGRFSVEHDSIFERNDVLMAVKLRLMEGLKSGDARAAASEVRELARLALTSERMIGVLTAVALLNIERRAYDVAVERRQSVDGWSPLSSVETQTLRDALWSARAPFMLLATAPLSETVLPVGACAGLQEALRDAHFLEGYLRAELPERYAALDAALATSKCRLTRMRSLWKGDDHAGQLAVKGSALCMSDPDAAEPLPSCKVPDFVTSLPFAKRFIGEKLLVLMTPDAFSRYREAIK